MQMFSNKKVSKEALPIFFLAYVMPERRKKQDVEDV